MTEVINHHIDKVMHSSFIHISFSHSCQFSTLLQQVVKGNKITDFSGFVGNVIR